MNLVVAKEEAGKFKILGRWAAEVLMDQCVRNGNLGLLKWLCEIGYPLGCREMTSPTSRGDLKMVKWLREQGMTLDRLDVYRVVGGGHLDMVKWMAEIGCFEKCIGLLPTAASGGHLKMMIWLYEQG